MGRSSGEVRDANDFVSRLRRQGRDLNLDDILQVLPCNMIGIPLAIMALGINSIACVPKTFRAIRAELCDILIPDPMMRTINQLLWVLCIVVGIGQGVSGSDPSDISLSKLAPALVKNSPVSEFLKLVGGVEGRVFGVSSNSGDGVRINGFSVKSEGVAFRVEGGGVFPLVQRPIPDPNVLAKAATLDELVDLFLPDHKANPALVKFFQERNSVPEAKIHLSQTGEQYVHRLGAIYVQDGRLIGVRCTLWYAATEKPRGSNEKISKLSIDSWISADISKLK